MTSTELRSESERVVQATPAAARPKNARVYALAERDRRRERMLALITVAVPTLSAVAAVVVIAAGRAGWTELALWMVGHTLGGLGIVLGFHRYASHRAFDGRKWIRALFVILGSMGSQGPVLWWAALHRRHHASSDREGDPHSPYTGGRSRMRGFWHSHVGWLFVHENTDWMHYIPDLLKDHLLARLNQYYFVWVVLGLVIPAAIGALVHGTGEGALLGLLFGGLLRVFTVQQTTWATNSLSHLFGSRPYESRDDSRNNLALILPTLGDGWHNNHHAFPTTAINQFEWWHFDPSGMVVRMLQAVGVVWDVHFPSREVREQHRRELSARVPPSAHAPELEGGARKGAEEGVRL